MKKTRILALMLALALAVCAFAACGEKTPVVDENNTPDVNETTNPVAKELGKNTLIMGTNAEFEPFEYHADNTIVGYDVDTANEIAAFAEMELQIEDMNFDSLIAALTTGKIDMILAGMSVTAEREEVVNFSNPYYRAAQVIIVPKEGATVASSADLAGKKIGVQEGTTGDAYVDETVESAELSRFKKAVDAAMDLTNGRLDAVVLDEQPAKRIVEQNDALMILDEALTEEEYAIAVRKDNPELLAMINNALAEIEANGKKDELLTKYALNFEEE